MKISLITVCWNAKKTIADAMASVAAQQGSRVEIEYIVVDGGSTDGTVREIENFAKKVEVEGRGRERMFEFRFVSEKDNGLYDAMNKGIRMATGDVVGTLNADDVLDGENVLARIASAFRDQGSGIGDQIDGVYGDIRFVRELGGRTVRYCSGKWFRPWMFRFAVMPAHPSIYLRRSCFEKYGLYSLDYRVCADFEMMLRLFWKHRIRTKYLPICTTVMRMGGLSTGGIRSNLEINREDLRAIRVHGYWSCMPLILCKYFFKIWGFVFRRLGV